MTIEEKVKAIAQAMSIMDSDRKAADERINKLTQFCTGLLSRMEAHDEELKQLKAQVADFARRNPSPDKIKKRSFTYDMWKRVQDLKASGATMSNISGMLNVPRSSVGKYARMTEEEALALPHETSVDELPLPDNSVSLKLEEKYE